VRNFAHGSAQCRRGWLRDGLSLCTRWCMWLAGCLPPRADVGGGLGYTRANASTDDQLYVGMSPLGVLSTHPHYGAWVRTPDGLLRGGKLREGRRTLARAPLLHPSRVRAPLLASQPASTTAADWRAGACPSRTHRPCLQGSFGALVSDGWTFFRAKSVLTKPLLHVSPPAVALSDRDALLLSEWAFLRAPRRKGVATIAWTMRPSAAP
jgi:hypothetical protein